VCSDYSSELAPFFEAYLKSLVTNHPKPLIVHYTSGILGSKTRTLASPPANIKAKNAPSLEIRILSPIFFATFIYYAHTTEAFDRAGVLADEKDRTVWISRPDILSDLIKSAPLSQIDMEHPSVLENTRWAAHRRLRRPDRVDDIRYFGFSPLDRFVMATLPNEAWQYRRLCARLFLARRCAFGVVGVIDLADLCVRVGLTWIAVGGFWGMAVIGFVHAWAFVKGSA